MSIKTLDDLQMISVRRRRRLLALHEVLLLVVEGERHQNPQSATGRRIWIRCFLACAESPALHQQKPERRKALLKREELLGLVRDRRRKSLHTMKGNEKLSSGSKVRLGVS